MLFISLAVPSSQVSRLLSQRFPGQLLLLKNQLLLLQNNQLTRRSYQPAPQSFEIWFKDVLLHSKLQSTSYPRLESVVQLTEMVLQQQSSIKGLSQLEKHRLKAINVAVPTSYNSIYLRQNFVYPKPLDSSTELPKIQKSKLSHQKSMISTRRHQQIDELTPFIHFRNDSKQIKGIDHRQQRVKVNNRLRQIIKKAQNNSVLKRKQQTKGKQTRLPFYMSFIKPDLRSPHRPKLKKLVHKQLDQQLLNSSKSSELLSNPKSSFKKQLRQVQMRESQQKNIQQSQHQVRNKLVCPLFSLTVDPSNNSKCPQVAADFSISKYIYPEADCQSIQIEEFREKDCRIQSVYQYFTVLFLQQTFIHLPFQSYFNPSLSQLLTFIIRLNPQFIKRIFRSQSHQKVSVFLFMRNKWQECLVETVVSVNKKNRVIECHQDTQQFWPCILERALIGRLGLSHYVRACIKQLVQIILGCFAIELPLQSLFHSKELINESEEPVIRTLLTVSTEGELGRVSGRVTNESKELLKIQRKGNSFQQEKQQFLTKFDKVLDFSSSLQYFYTSRSILYDLETVVSFALVLGSESSLTLAFCLLDQDGDSLEQKVRLQVELYEKEGSNLTLSSKSQFQVCIFNLKFKFKRSEYTLVIRPIQSKGKCSLSIGVVGLSRLNHFERLAAQAGEEAIGRE